LRQSWNKEALAGGLCWGKDRVVQGGDGPPSLDFPIKRRKPNFKAPHPRLIPEKAVLSNAFGLIGKYQITLYVNYLAFSIWSCCQ